MSVNAWKSPYHALKPLKMTADEDDSSFIDSSGGSMRRCVRLVNDSILEACPDNADVNEFLGSEMIGFMKMFFSSLSRTK